MIDIPRDSSPLVMIDQKARICPPNKIVMLDNQNVRELHKVDSNSRKRDSQVKEKLRVKTNKENNLKLNQLKMHLLSNSAQLILDAQTSLNISKRPMARRHASCQTAIMLDMDTLNLASTVTIPTEDGSILVMSFS